MPPVLAPMPVNRSAPDLSIRVEAMLSQAMHRALGCADAGQALRLLECAADIALEVTIRSSWLPLANELGRDGSTLDGDGRLGHLLRLKIRQVLIKEADIPVTYWLVPAKRTDITSTHLAALVFTRRGTGARVWQWPMPVLGAILTVGDSGGLQPGDGRIPIHGQGQHWPSLEALVA